MKHILTVAICMLFIPGIVVADQTGADHSVLLPHIRTEQSGPSPSKGWFAAKITN